MNLARLVRCGVVLLGILACSETSAQQNADNQFKEIKPTANAFSLSDPVPAWVDPTEIPEVSGAQPIIIRLADTQFLVDRVPVVYVRRAMQINDAASLTAAGRFSIAFAPEYERVQLHAIHIYRGQERLDRTSTSTVRFLQREQGLEQGIYSGRVTASILIDDLRVGDTLDISYSTYGENPVFGGKYSSSSGWDQPYPTLRRRVVFNHPLERRIAWRMIGDRSAPPVIPKEPLATECAELNSSSARCRDGERSNRRSPTSLPPDSSSFRNIRTGPTSQAGRRHCFKPRRSATISSRWFGEFALSVRTRRASPRRWEFVQSEIRYFSVAWRELAQARGAR